MKYVVALFQHETNTFSDLKTPLQAFATPAGYTDPPAGEQAIAAYGSADFAFAAMLDLARAREDEIVVPVVAYAEPSGLVLDAAFDEIAGRICAAVEEGCDAVLLDLHGAMVTESYDDGEGELLRRIRACAPGVPIAVALDFHANLTATMVENSTVIDGYRTYPHVDMYETGERATKTLLRIMDEGLHTRQCYRALPIMTHMLKQSPLDEPMRSIMHSMIAATAEPTILNAVLLAGFPLADIPHVALSLVVTEVVPPNRALSLSASLKNHGAEGQNKGTTAPAAPEPSAAEQLIHQVSQQVWAAREAFTYTPQPLADSIAYARALDEFPVAVVDLSDGCGAGGNTDDMTVLAEMLRQGCEQIVAGPLWDVAAVDYLIRCGEGSEVELDIGGKTDVPLLGVKGKPLSCRGVVRKITDGRFTINGPMQTGLTVNLGRTVVLDIGAAQLLICEERWEPYDPGCFIHAGIEPFAARYILIKSRQHFRATFEEPVQHIVLASAPGVSNVPLREEYYSRLQRPVYPLDEWV